MLRDPFESVLAKLLLLIVNHARLALSCVYQNLIMCFYSRDKKARIPFSQTCTMYVTFSFTWRILLFTWDYQKINSFWSLQLDYMLKKSDILESLFWGRGSYPQVLPVLVRVNYWSCPQSKPYEGKLYAPLLLAYLQWYCSTKGNITS